VRVQTPTFLCAYVAHMFVQDSLWCGKTLWATQQNSCKTLSGFTQILLTIKFFLECLRPRRNDYSQQFWPNNVLLSSSDVCTKLIISSLRTLKDGEISVNLKFRSCKQINKRDFWHHTSLMVSKQSSRTNSRKRSTFAIFLPPNTSDVAIPSKIHEFRS